MSEYFIPKKFMPAWSRLDKDQTIKCLGCETAVEMCNCIWSAIRDLQENVFKLQEKAKEDCFWLAKRNDETNSSFICLKEKISELEAKTSALGKQLGAPKSDETLEKKLGGLAYGLSNCTLCKGHGRVSVEDESRGEADSWHIVHCPQCNNQGRVFVP